MDPKEDLIPVEGHDGWYRDPSSNAIVNCDTDAYEDYMAKYNARQRKKDKDNALQKDVDALKSELSDIKDLLQLLIKKESSWLKR